MVYQSKDDQVTVVAAGQSLHEALAAAEHLKKGQWHSLGCVGKLNLKYTEISKSLHFPHFAAILFIQVLFIFHSLFNAKASQQTILIIEIIIHTQIGFLWQDIFSIWNFTVHLGLLIYHSS